MCGIAGIYSNKSTIADQITAMTRAQLHRGPDDEGVDIFRLPNGNLGLGHRRLSIIDLSDAGRQPMKADTTGDCIVFNGEIYNYRELRKELKDQGVRFRSNTDTEVILHGFIQWGTSCFERLKGMYALAIYQPSKQRLILARDPLGIKPLYYILKPNLFAFASELRALLCSSALSGAIDHRALTGYLAYGAVQEPFTLLEDAQMLPPGTWATLDLNKRLPSKLSCISHWKFPSPVNHIGQEQSIEMISKFLEDAVSRHLASDVPVGLFLSSGLDSTTLATIAVKYLQNLQTFTVSLQDKSTDEAPIAEQTAQRLGTTHHKIRLSNDEVLLYTKDYFSVLDQPTIDGLNTYIISKAVRSMGIKVALSGLGGDELFGGYPSIVKLCRWLPWATRLSRVPTPGKKALAAFFKRFLPDPQGLKAVDMIFSRPNIWSLGLQRRRLFSQTELRNFDLDLEESDLTDEFQLEGYHQIEQWFDDNPAAALSIVQSTAYMGNMLLRDADVFGMANSLEIRVPFLDRDLIDFVYRLPGNFKQPLNGISKPLLVKAMGERIPPKMLTQPKRGFSLMQDEWLRGPLNEFCKHSLESAAEILGEAPVWTMWRQFIGTGNNRLWSRIWACVSLGVWHKNISTIRGSISN